MRVEVETRRSPRSDRRPPVTIDSPPAAPTGADGPGGLDWLAFSAAHFPGRRRHDLEALTAYSAYKRSRDAGTASSAQPAGAAGRGAPGETALREWEDEGGATLSLDRP